MDKKDKAAENISRNPRSPMLASVKAMSAKAIDLLGLREVAFFGGLGCVWFGLAQVYEPAAWCVVGAALFWLSAVKGAHSKGSDEPVRGFMLPGRE